MGAPLEQQYLDLLGPSGPAAPSVTVTVPTGAGGERAMHGGYDAADRYDRTVALWRAPLQSPDADILPDKDKIDGRTRDMLRNDAFVQGGQNLHKDNIVGAQYLLNSRPASRVLFGKQDDTWEEEFQEEVEEKFDLFAESPDHWIDAARTNNFTSMVRMAVGIHLMSGEMLASVEWLRDFGRPYKTAIQMVDLDRLTTDPRSANDRNVRAGVRFNAQGAPIAYQIRTEHPNDIDYSFKLPEWKEIPIRKPWGRLQMIHLYEQLRPDQTRGIPEMAAALKEMRMSHKWRDVSLQNAVLQATYAAAITSDLPPEQAFMSLGGGQMDAAGVQALISNYAQGYLNSIAEYAGSARNLQIDGIKVPHLYPGTKLEMLAPAAKGPLGNEFEQSLLRYIAASIGVSYEQLSRDYTNTNYSSARAAMTETWKFMQARKKLIADRFASIVYRLWLEEAINNGLIASVPRAMKNPGWLYEAQRLDAVSRCEWIGASRGQIDELKETQAAVLRINSGLSTAEDELARLGKDWRKTYRQIKREQELRKTLGLILATPDTAALMAASNEDTAPTAPEKKAA